MATVEAGDSAGTQTACGRVRGARPGDGRGARQRAVNPQIVMLAGTDENPPPAEVTSAAGALRAGEP